jgi:hypothetical protein
MVKVNRLKILWKPRVKGNKRKIYTRTPLIRPINNNFLRTGFFFKKTTIINAITVDSGIN